MALGVAVFVLVDLARGRLAMTPIEDTVLLVVRFRETLLLVDVIFGATVLTVVTFGIGLPTIVAFGTVPFTTVPNEVALLAIVGVKRAKALEEVILGIELLKAISSEPVLLEVVVVHTAELLVMVTFGT